MLVKTGTILGWKTLGWLKSKFTAIKQNPIFKQSDFCITKFLAIFLWENKRYLTGIQTSSLFTQVWFGSVTLATSDALHDQRQEAELLWMAD